MNWFEQRRRMLLSSLDNKIYIFKEGEGLVWGHYLSYDEYYTYCSPEYIVVQGRNWGTGDDDDASYGIMLGGSPIEQEEANEGWSSSDNGYDFSEYKTLCIEIEVYSPNYSNVAFDPDYGYVGYRGNHRRFSKGFLHHEDSAFNSQNIKDLYEDGSYQIVRPQSRNVISFDISDIVDAQIVLLSPHSRDVIFSNLTPQYNHMKVYNIWVEGKINRSFDDTATYIYRAGYTDWDNVLEVSYTNEEPITKFSTNYVSLDGGSTPGMSQIVDLKVDFTNYSELVIKCATSYATSRIGYGTDSDSTNFTEKLEASANGSIHTYTFDISTLTGDSYIKLAPPATTGSPLYITEIKLVP